MIAPPSEPIAILQLLWRVDHALGTLSRQMLARLGVTSPQRVVLRSLLRAPEITGSGLAEVLQVDRSSVAGILHRMEESGLIERSPDEADARKQRIRLTEKGRRLDALQRGTVEAALARTLDAMDEPQIRVLSAFLLSFSAELERERAALAQEAR